MERVYLRDDVELTRHVRTEAGVKKYHKPIGTPLGGGHTPTKLKVRLNSPGTLTQLLKETGGQEVKVSPTSGSKKRKKSKSKKRVAKVKPVISPVQTRAMKPTNPVALAAERHLLAVPNGIPPEKRAAVEKILNQHDDVSKAIDEMHSEAMSDPSKEGRLFAHIYKIAPFLKPGLEKVRKSKAGRKLKEVDYFHVVVDTFFDHFLGTFIGSGAVAMGASFGLKLLGGG